VKPDRVQKHKGGDRLKAARLAHFSALSAVPVPPNHVHRRFYLIRIETGSIRLTRSGLGADPVDSREQ